MTTNETLMSRIYPAQRTPSQKTLLKFGSVNDLVQKFHYSSATIPDIRLYGVSDVTLAGSSNILKDNLILGSVDLFPKYVHFFQTSGIVKIPLEPLSHVKIIPYPVYFITHFNVNSYGHFLLECLPKILVVDHLYKVGYKFPLLIPTSLPKFARNIITQVNSEFQITDYDIRCSLNVARILLPSMCQSDYLFHPFYVDCLERLTSTLSYRQPGRTRCSNRRIYVIRSEVGSQSFLRRPLNQSELIRIAEIRGFEAIDPAKMTLNQQANIFSQAEYIIGEYGSGMHNTIFCGPDVQVLAINWVNEVQQRIAQTRQHRIGFVLADDGEPRYFSSDNAIRQDYFVNPWRFGRAVDSMWR